MLWASLYVPMLSCRLSTRLTNYCSYQFAQVLDFYLRPENKTYWDQIVALSAKDRPATGKSTDDETLTRYILEGARLTSTATSVRTVAPADGKPITLVVDQAGTKVTLNPGDRVISSTVCSPSLTLHQNHANRR